MKEEKYFYLCNQKMHCNTLQNGKKNEYCGYDCRHTNDIGFAKKREHKFRKDEYKDVILYWEV